MKNIKIGLCLLIVYSLFFAAACKPSTLSKAVRASSDVIAIAEALRAGIDAEYTAGKISLAAKDKSLFALKQVVLLDIEYNQTLRDFVSSGVSPTPAQLVQLGAKFDLQLLQPFFAIIDIFNNEILSQKLKIILGGIRSALLIMSAVFTQPVAARSPGFVRLQNMEV